MSFLQEEGPLRRLLKNGPFRRFIRGERAFEEDFDYQMVPIPPDVDPVDFVINVAQGDWARGAAEGWVRRLGLSVGTAEGNDLMRRMQIAYAAGATRASPQVAVEAQRRLGIPPGPMPPIPPPAAPRRRRVVAVTPPAAAPAMVPPFTEREQTIINTVFDEAVAMGMSPNIPRSSLATEARNKGVQDPDRVIEGMIDAGLLEVRGRFLSRPRPSR